MVINLNKSDNKNVKNNLLKQVNKRKYCISHSQNQQYFLKTNNK